ncbi:MAG: glycosyltransferase [Anaerolineales bacterium]|jgi:glycosyltransferase involved in cell wall biosynthesis|nr:glycosyltransferase [Anaerolineales bacterium]
MRIGMMADTYKPHMSGITNYIELNKRVLEEAGHDVFVFTIGDTDYEDNERRVIRSPGLPLTDTGYYLSFQYSRKAKALLQTMDVAHVHHPFLSGRLALRYCRPLNIPVIFTNHTRYDIYAQTYLPGLPESITDTLMETYMPDFCSAINLVISPSPGMAAVLRKFKVDAPIMVVPNGVELSRFQKAAPLARADFGYKPEDILMVYTGRLAPEKNLPFLLKAFFGVAQALDNVHLLLIGDGSEREDLVEQAAANPVGERIHFTGKIPYENLPGYLAMCDLFVTASISEVHPLSVIEAMGAGLPVLGIHSVGVGDTVLDNISGLLAPEDLPAFTAKLTRLCMDSGLRKKMGQAARKEAQRYDIQRTSQAMLLHYQRLNTESGPRKASFSTRLKTFFERFKT